MSARCEMICAPEAWARELYRVIDIDGVECAVYRDQDGDVFIVAVD